MFRSTRHALQFAFRTMASPIIKMSSINNMRGAGGNGDMTPHDRHAQAAMIVAMVERSLDLREIALIYAQYRHELNNGEKESEVISVITPAIIASFPTGMHSKRGVEKLIRIYFGKEVGQASLRADFKCTNIQCQEYKRIAFKVMNDILDGAESKLSIQFEIAGLIANELETA